MVDRSKQAQAWLAPHPRDVEFDIDSLTALLDSVAQERDERAEEIVEELMGAEDLQVLKGEIKRRLEEP